MRIIDASYDIIHFMPICDVYRICFGYSLCYKVPVPDDYEAQCNYIRKHRNHESPLEHSSMSVHFIINRGVSHELVRHRHTSYSQESTRYCNYSKDRFDNRITYIKNSHIIEDSDSYNLWIDGLARTENEYFARLACGETPEEARGCLPIDLKTEMLVTTNFREWRNIFKLRCESHAHYQMREVMKPLFKTVRDELPCIFDDISLD